MVIQRKENWPMLLSAYLAAARTKPFQWGENDCMLFVSKCVEELTGVNFYDEFLGYIDEAGAKTAVESHGGIFEIIKNCLGEGTRQILTGGRGDVAVVSCPDLTGGIIDDSGEFICVVTAQGMQRLPLKKALMVWSY